MNLNIDVVARKSEVEGAALQIQFLRKPTPRISLFILVKYPQITTDADTFGENFGFALIRHHAPNSQIGKEYQSSGNWELAII